MTKFALSSVLIFVLSLLAYAGPEQYSGKEMKQAVEQPMAPQWYADNEWNVSVWGTYVFTDNGATQQQERVPISGWADHFLGVDDAWGGGVDLKYFFHRYFGLGIEGYGLWVHRDAPDIPRNVTPGQNGNPFRLQDEDRAVGAVLGTFTVRFPFGRFAPYVFAGGGGIFGGGDIQEVELTGQRGGGLDYAEIYRGGDTSAALGQFGGGLEVRFTHHIGWLADFSWNVVDGPKNNFGMVRSGVNFAF
jgi:hypothetical protein